MSFLKIVLLVLAFFQKLRSEGILISGGYVLAVLFNLFEFNCLLSFEPIDDILDLLLLFSLHLGLKFFVDLFPLLVQLISESVFFLCALLSQILLQLLVLHLVLIVHLLPQGIYIVVTFIFQLSSIG